MAARGDDLDAVVAGEGLEADGAVLDERPSWRPRRVRRSREDGQRGGGGGGARRRTPGRAPDLAHDAAARAGDGALPGAAAVGAEQDEAEDDGDEYHGGGRARRRLNWGRRRTPGRPPAWPAARRRRPGASRAAPWPCSGRPVCATPTRSGCSFLRAFGLWECEEAEESFYLGYRWHLRS